MTTDNNVGRTVNRLIRLNRKNKRKNYLYVFTRIIKAGIKIKNTT